MNSQEQKKIEEFFKNNKVSVVKMNHSLSTSGHTQFDAFMQLQSDGDSMEITKKVVYVGTSF